jgi:hypothetical protein
MTAPVILSVTPASASLSPGEFVDVTIDAFDPDSANGSVVFPVTDSQGNRTDALIDLTLLDPLSWEVAENPNALAVTVARLTALGVTPAVYRVTAN